MYTDRQAIAEIVQAVAHYHHPCQRGDAGIFQLLPRVALTMTVGVVVLVVVVMENMMVVMMVVNEII